MTKCKFDREVHPAIPFPRAIEPSLPTELLKSKLYVFSFLLNIH